MEQNMAILQRLGEIQRDSLTLRVTPAQIDTRLTNVTRSVNEYGRPSHRPAKSSSANQRQRTRRVSRERTAPTNTARRPHRKSGGSRIDLQGTLHNPEIAKQQASEILESMGISMMDVRNSSFTAPSVAAARSSFRSQHQHQLRPQLEPEPPRQPQPQPHMSIDGGGSALLTSMDHYYDGGSMVGINNNNHHIDDLNIDQQAVNMHEHDTGGHAAHTMDAGLSMLDDLSYRASSSFVPTGHCSGISLTLPVLSTLNKAEKNEISRMPKPNELERSQYESIKKQFIESECMPEDGPYHHLSSRWPRSSSASVYHRLTESSSVVSLQDMSKQVVTNAERSRHHSEDRPNNNTINTHNTINTNGTHDTNNTIAANTHGSTVLVPLEIVRKRKRLRKRRRIQPTSSSIETLEDEDHLANRSSRTKKNGVHGHTLYSSGSSIFEESPSSTSVTSITPMSSSSMFDTRSTILLKSLEYSKLQQQKINSKLQLEIFATRQNIIPLEMQGPGGFMSRVSAILKAANGRRLLQLRVNSFGHWKTMMLVLRNIERTANAKIIQSCWRIYLAKKEWMLRLQAAKRQQEQLLLMKKIKEEKQHLAQVTIAKYFRCWLQKWQYIEDLQLDKAARIVQRSYRCSRARNDLMLRLVRFTKRMNATEIIQCAWRCCRARIQHFLLFRIKEAEDHIAANLQRAKEYEYHFQLIGSACIVQTWWRSCMLMVRAKYRIKAIKFRAAMYIACWWRGWYERRGIIQRKRNKRTERRKVEHMASVKIQNMCRLHRSRKRMKKILKANEKIKKMRIANKQRLEEEAKGTTTVEKQLVNMKKMGRFLYRSGQSLVKPNLKESAALTIQCAWRRYEAKRNGVVRQKLYLKQKQNRLLRELKVKSSTAIQKIFRGYCVRLTFGNIKSDAATLIQRNFRLYHARQWFKRTIYEIRAQRQGASQIIQSYWRKYKGRSNYLSQIMIYRKRLPACTKIQQYYRRHLGLRTYYNRLETLKRNHEEYIIGEDGVNVLTKCLEDYILFDHLTRGRKSIKFLLQQCFHYWCDGTIPNDAMQSTTDVPLEALTLASGSKFKTFCHNAFLSTAPPTSTKTTKSKSMTQSELDTIFASKKGKHDRGLTFETFVLFLREVADRYYYYDVKKYDQKRKSKKKNENATDGTCTSDHQSEVATQNLPDTTEETKGDSATALSTLTTPGTTPGTPGTTPTKPTTPTTPTTRTTATTPVATLVVEFSYAALRRKQTPLKLPSPRPSYKKRLSREEKKKLNDSNKLKVFNGPDLVSTSSRSKSTLAPWLIGYSGSDARVLKLLTDRVLHDKDFKKIPSLGKKGLRKVVQQYMSKQTKRVQNRWRGVEARVGYLNAKEQAEALRSLRIKMKAATIIQSTIARPYLSKKRMKQKASDIYIEYQTQNSGRGGRGTTWYNPSTNREYSSYPPSLLTLKVGKSKKRAACQTSVLPHLDKMFTLQCTQCLNKHSGNEEQEKTGQCKDATVFCVDCEESFCEECYDNSHHRGCRAKHTVKKIPKCNECRLWHRPKPYNQIQIASINVRYGTTNNKKTSTGSAITTNSMSRDASHSLCDECWNWIVMPRLEKEDKLSSTMTKRLVATCVWCGKYAARWSCMECAAVSRKDVHIEKMSFQKKKKKKSTGGEEEEEKEEEEEQDEMLPDLYCHECYENTHSHGRRAHHRSKPVPYYPLQLQLIEMKEIQKKNEQKKLLRLTKRMKQIEHKRNSNIGSIVIQKYWRRYYQRNIYYKKKKADRKRNHYLWKQKRMDDHIRNTYRYKMKSLVGMEPTLPSDSVELDKKTMRKLTRTLGLVPRVAINNMDLYKDGQSIVIRKSSSMYNYCRGEILSTTPSHATVYVFDLSKTITIGIDDIAVEKGMLARVRREKRREKDVERLESAVWFGMEIPTGPWTAQKKYEAKKLKKTKKYAAKKFTHETQQKEKMEMATKQAERDQKTVEEFLTKGQLWELTKPFEETLTEFEISNQPQFSSPYNVESWNIQYNHILDLKEAAEWESRVLDRRQPHVVTWHNVVTNEVKLFKPKVLVKTKDKIWRNTLGNLKEFYKERTIQSYSRKRWDHNSAPRSIWGKKGPPKKKKGVAGLVGAKGGATEEEEEVDENDTDYVGPWEEEEQGLNEEGEMTYIYVKRKGKKGEGGEIVESANEKPLEMMTPAELEVIKEAKAAKVQAEKEAKTRKLEMEVAKAARERKKKRGGRRKK